jgi:hypothetical protein
MGVTWLNLDKFVVGDRDQNVMMISMTLHFERKKELRQTVRRLNNNSIFDFFCLFLPTKATGSPYSTRLAPLHVFT